MAALWEELASCLARVDAGEELDVALVRSIAARGVESNYSAINHATKKEEPHVARLREWEEKWLTQERFIATLCHELRTPLNGMSGWIEILASKVKAAPHDVGDTVAKKEAVREAHQNGDMSPIYAMIDAVYGDVGYGGSRGLLDVLSKLQACVRLNLAVVEDLLDWTRASTGNGATPEFVEFRLVDLLSEAVDLVRAAHSTDGIDSAVTVYTSADVPLRGDRRRLIQVLINLLSNAFKACSAGGGAAVTVDARADGTAHRDGALSVCIGVRDSGCGMDASAVERIGRGGFASPADGAAYGDARQDSTGCERLPVPPPRLPVYPRVTRAGSACP